MSVVSNIGVTERPKPPADLNKEQKDEWRRVVERLPADWFPGETHSMLAGYCRHHSNALRVGVLIEEMLGRPLSGEGNDPDFCFDLDAYDKLLKMQERESRAQVASARSLRFTLQASYDKSKKKGSKTKAPWK